MLCSEAGVRGAAAWCAALGLLLSGCGLGGESAQAAVTAGPPTPGAAASTGVPCEPQQGVDLRLVAVATGLRKPVLLTAPVGDSRRFVVEQPGRIRILDEGGEHAVFLDIRRRVETGFGEQGLLGLAFHPDYATNGRFYVNYTEAGTGTTVLAEHRVSADPSVAQTRERRLLTVKQPYANHNGGHIAFGPDGLLYLGMGDGGAGGDPQGHGQNPQTLLGTLSRLDVNMPNAAVEVVAIGLRNPWRWSFDRGTGDLWIGDVGQGSYEEIDRLPAGVTGLNFGWNTMEGTHCYPGEDCDRKGLTLPVIDVPRSGRCDSITGGYVYRGACLPDLQGTYLYGDYCDNWVRSLRLQKGSATDLRDLTSSLGVSVDGVSSFGEDAAGELYVLSHRDGVVYQLAGR